jgi:hypothetical protein
MRPIGPTKANISSSVLVLIVAAIFFWQQSVPPSFSQTINPQAGGVSDLKIIVLTGEDGVNIIKKKTAVKPVVEVRDKNNLPVAGVYVTFLAPDSGPGVIFTGGTRTFSTLSDAAGHAAVPSMKPVGKGAFKIAIKASFQGHVTTATIAQTNYLTVAAAHAAGAAVGTAGGSGAAGGAAGGAVAAGGATAGGISAATIGIIVAGVAAAAGVAVAVAKGKSSKAPSASIPTGTIGGALPPTITPPH